LANASIIKKLPGGIGLGVFFSTISFIFYLDNSICYYDDAKRSCPQEKLQNPNLKCQMKYQNPNAKIICHLKIGNFICN